MNNLTMNILGFAAVNRDLRVEVRDPVTQNVVREVRPFLDGTVRVPQIQAGAYDIHVFHPNLPRPVITRPIHVLPHGDTNVTVMIDPTKFRNTPIEDIPEANLAPVADLARSIAETVAPLAAKTPGEAIRASDWNALAGAVRDLSNSTGELTRLVSPVGHDHPEIIAKIDEMSTNFQTLLDTMSQALAELQRQIQTLRLRRQVEEVLDAADIGVESTKGVEFTRLIENLEDKITASPAVFSKELRNVAIQMGTQLESVIDAKPGVVATPQVESISKSIDLLKEQRSNSYGSEISFNRKLDRNMGGSAIKVLKR